MTGLQISITNVIGQSKADLNIYLISEEGDFLISGADGYRLITE
jgi:hypothetical protein